MAEANVVPFGKYRGQPVETLVADGDYCDWLSAQPWFRDRYTGIYQIILNGPQPPTETPEHNEMQARFLSDEVCIALARVLSPKVEWEVKPRTVAELAKGKVSAIPFSRTVDDNERAADEALKYPDYFEVVPHGPEVLEREFEDRGWDVVFEIRTPCYDIRLRSQPDCTCRCDCAKCPHSRPDISYNSCYHDNCYRENGERRRHCNDDCPYRDTSVFDKLGASWEMVWDSRSYAVECKPDLGDDFPAVLRQVKGYDRRGSRCVAVRRFAAQGATWDQVVAMFATAEVALVMEG